MKVCVIGLGYIGFPTACIVANAGHEVLGVDINSELIHQLKNGGLHIVNEEGLSELAHSVFESGHLRVSESPETADVFIVTVPTPRRSLRSTAPKSLVTTEAAAGPADSAEVVTGLKEQTGFGPQECSFRSPISIGADLSYVENATRGIASHVQPGNLVILESTVPPGTTDSVVRCIIEEETGLVCGRDMFIAHAPERVLPGKLVKELTENDRVIGGINKESTARAVSFYRTFVSGDVIGTDATTAELVKLMENTFRDVNIALANEFALISEKLDIDVFEAIALANRHPRVNILAPGPGVGGHCIPVDPNFIVESVPDKARLISLARQINSSMPQHVVSLASRIRNEALESGIEVKRVVGLGASYKPNVGDQRQSPALEIASLLADEGYEVDIHDPYILRFSSKNVLEMLDGSDLLVMLTDHKVYREQLNPSDVHRRMRNHFVLDTRGFFGPEWDDAGFYVVRLGVGHRH